ncbi:MAG: carbon starvation CstA family protein [Flavobacteriales bacterium]|nr:carbon starvation CstA family protein [Flavobacteriales bacterium]
MISFFICLTLLVGSYFTYAVYLDKKVFVADSSKSVPSINKKDDVDFLPMPMWKTFLIQLLNIAGLGPIFGAIMGAMYGPVAFIWITCGCIFIGAVQDYASGMISLREGGMSFPEIVGKYMGPLVKHIMRFSTIFLIVLVGAVFMVGPAGIIESISGMPKTIWVYIILVYYILATMLPIDKIIGQIYPIFGAALIFMAFGILYVITTRGYDIPEISFANLHNMNIRPDKFPIFPTLFITIACGAISGFHATQSPMMARCVRNEKEGRPVFFGAMIAEGIIALIWAAIGMAFWGGVDGLNTAMAEHGNNAAWAVNSITNSTMGKVGALLALLGVVVAPITSGDTAFRSARLMIADMLGMEQHSIKKRLYICVPLFIVGFSITLMPFDVLWRYFAWANQVLAAICLWTITVYLFIKDKQYWLTFLPAMFMTFIVSFYIMFSPEGFATDYYLAMGCGGVFTIMVSYIVFLYMKRVKSRIRRGIVTFN